MELTNLQTRPDKFNDTLQLIEREFEYNSENSFATDFKPLIDAKNFHNLNILIENDEVIGHLGVLEKTFKINNKDFLVAFLGGIVIKDSYQGKGLSKLLMDHVEALKNQYSFILLWSDKTDYYKKFEYYPCIQQFQYEQSLCKNSFHQVAINFENLNAIKELYHSSNELRPHRTQDDWNTIIDMTSTQLYLKQNENGDTDNYFFINKGQDLNGVIHEYGKIDKEMLNYGFLWSPLEVKELVPTHQYAALLKIGNHADFQDFILNVTNEKINIHAIDSHKVDFSFNNQRFQQNIDEFLTGVLGPSRYEELDDCPLMFIPGLDSI